jgi:hypothetical protein
VLLVIAKDPEVAREGSEVSGQSNEGEELYQGGLIREGGEDITWD